MCPRLADHSGSSAISSCASTTRFSTLARADLGSPSQSESPTEEGSMCASVRAHGVQSASLGPLLLSMKENRRARVSEDGTGIRYRVCEQLGLILITHSHRHNLIAHGHDKKYALDPDSRLRLWAYFAWSECQCDKYLAWTSNLILVTWQICAI